MSIIKSIKQVLGLGPAAESHHWDGSVPNQLSLKRGTPDAPGAELIKALNGMLSFPNQGQVLANDGYVQLPGGLILQWGRATTSAGGSVAVNFPIPFPTQLFGVVSQVVNGGSISGGNNGGSLSAVTLYAFNSTTATGVSTSVRYIALGV